MKLVDEIIQMPNLERLGICSECQFLSSLFGYAANVR